MPRRLLGRIDGASSSLGREVVDVGAACWLRVGVTAAGRSRQEQAAGTPARGRRPIAHLVLAAGGERPRRMTTGAPSKGGRAKVRSSSGRAAARPRQIPAADEEEPRGSDRSRLPSSTCARSRGDGVGGPMLPDSSGLLGLGAWILGGDGLPLPPSAAGRLPPTAAGVEGSVEGGVWRRRRGRLGVAWG